MATRVRIEAPRPEIEAFCKKHHIRKFSFFGPVLRDDFGAESDVDVLVEFERGRVPGLIRFAAMENELSAILGRKADLRTAEDLSRYFRQEVVRQAEVLCAL